MKKKIDRCDLCGGELKLGKTTLEIWRGADLVVIKDVVADVCQQCDEAYLSAETSKKLDDFLRDYQRRKPERFISVPQYSPLQVVGG
ncbi:MAG: type II toxin-antitoxin system MqsA family antitoxin [Chloroflexi bacterium]|nr:type II toxin-antitoxin system MqsA family antitoxin [Chloroflexota bacterium]